ncbi:hypothetical protein SDC9_195560 [bioreactor metagenome]|uniref:Uncharacterized protein n=1 Tax=bioreactor metagenome TaxID=1076179 RepID=A0A645IAL8_9ZZZZ
MSLQNCLTVSAITGPLQTTGSVSFSRSRLTDIMSIPVLLLTGIIYVSFPVALFLRPKALGIEGPVISASSMAVRWPLLFIKTASIEVISDFPTPPFPLTIPITFLMLLSSFGSTKRLSVFWRLLQFASQVSQSCVHSSLIFSTSPVYFISGLYQGV